MLLTKEDNILLWNQTLHFHANQEIFNIIACVYWIAFSDCLHIMFTNNYVTDRPFNV